MHYAGRAAGPSGQFAPGQLMIEGMAPGQAEAEERGGPVRHGFMGPEPAPVEVLDWEVVKLSSDPWDRLMAHALGVVGTFVPAPVVLAFSVNVELEIGRRIARLSPAFADGSTRSLAELLRRVAPVTPFAPRRAANAGATLLTARDVCAGPAFRRSIYVEELHRAGLSPPL